MHAVYHVLATLIDLPTKQKQNVSLCAASSSAERAPVCSLEVMHSTCMTIGHTDGYPRPGKETETSTNLIC